MKAGSHHTLEARTKMSKSRMGISTAGRKRKPLSSEHKDNEFVFGDKKSLDLCENMIRDRDVWKAKAIEERANIILGFEVTRLRDKKETDEIRLKAARELEEEMKHDI